MLVAPTVPTTPQSPPHAGSIISDTSLWAQLNATSSRKPTSSPELPPQLSAAPSTFLWAAQPQARRHQARMVGAGLPPLGLTPGLSKGGVRSNKITSRGHLHTNHKLVHNPKFFPESLCTPSPRTECPPEDRPQQWVTGSSSRQGQDPFKGHVGGGDIDQHGLTELRGANEPRGGDRAGVCSALGLYLTLPQQLGTFPVPPPPQPHGAQSP